MVLMEGEVGTMGLEGGHHDLEGGFHGLKDGHHDLEGAHLLSQEVLQLGPGLDSGAGVALGKAGVPRVLMRAPLPLQN